MVGGFYYNGVSLETKMSRCENEVLEGIKTAVTVYDLGLAWEWEYDMDFVYLLETACYHRGLTLLQVTPGTLETILSSFWNNEITFRAFLDRASDAREQFLALIERIRCQEAKGEKMLRINRFRLARQAWNKVFCQDQFTNAGLSTPATIVIPSYVEAPDLSPANLSKLGATFSIKPAHGGGGQGVVNEATAWEQVLSARQHYPSDQYLLQASVTPAEINGRKAWFRVLYCTGEVYPCWWDTHTHVYTLFCPTPEFQFLYDCLHQTILSIARICKLELFSTEIAYTENSACVIVDYINDPVDLRVQSKACDGVPDKIVADIADRLAALVASYP